MFVWLDINSSSVVLFLQVASSEPGTFLLNVLISLIRIVIIGTIYQNLLIPFPLTSNNGVYGVPPLNRDQSCKPGLAICNDWNFWQEVLYDEQFAVCFGKLSGEAECLDLNWMFTYLQIANDFCSFC